MGLKALGSNIGRQGLIPKAGGGGGASTDPDAAAWFAVCFRFERYREHTK